MITNFFLLWNEQANEQMTQAGSQEGHLQNQSFPVPVLARTLPTLQTET